MVTMIKRDVDIQSDVLDELAFDPEVESTDVGVAVDDGVVTLTGTVETYAEKWAAERATFRVAGVRAGANEIVVKPEGTGLLDDAEIAKAIANGFEHNVLIPHGTQIHVAQGGVTLAGKAQWQYQRTAAENVARAVRGVRWVSNMIAVEQPAIAYHEIEKAIKQALKRSAAVDADRVHVEVHGRELTLSGTVRSYAERNEAEAAAWRTKGVIAITNTIAVRL